MAHMFLALFALLLSAVVTSQGFDDESALVQLSPFQDIEYGGHPSEDPKGFNLIPGEILVGVMKCGFTDVGMRFKVGNPSTVGRVDVFPTSYKAPFADRWCPPLSVCHSGFDVTGSVDPEDDHSYTFNPVNGSDESMQQACHWNAFSFTGRSEGMVSAIFRGHLLEKTRFKTEFPSSQPDIRERTAKSCDDIRRGIIAAGFHIDCDIIELEKCIGSEPSEKDKVLYLVESFGSADPDEKDSLIPPMSEARALSIVEAPYFVDAFGPDASRPIEVVMIAPMARAIETATLAFGNTGAKLEISPYLLSSRYVIPDKGHCHDALSKANNNNYLPASAAWDLAKQIDETIDFLHGDPIHTLKPSVERFIDLKKMLLARPEKHFIIVCENNFFDAFNMRDLPGDIRPVLLKADLMAETYDPRCWEHM